MDESGATVSATTAQKLMQQMQAQLSKPSPSFGTPSAPPAAKKGSVSEEELELRLEDDESPSDKSRSPRRAVAQYQAEAAAQMVDQSARTRQRVAPPTAIPAPAAPVRAAAAPPPPPSLSAASSGAAAASPSVGAATVSVEDVLSSDALRKAIEKEARQARLIRSAVVLGEKEYCVLIDPDGKREQIGRASCRERV